MKLKKFRSTSGLDILVGQDDESNDSLTFRIGHANDIWMHVSGAPGSHVLLRCGEIKVEADKTSLQEAAGLAAWYSRLRHGGKVAVSYCRVKDVGKRRGAESGKVTIKRAKKLTVRPKLLQEIGD